MPFKATAIGIVVLTIGGIAAGCGGSDDSADGDSAAGKTGPAATSPAAQSTTPQAAARKQGISIKIRDSRFGRMLFDAKGQAIYLFTKESGTKPRCYGACADAWPPVLTRAAPRAKSGVDKAKLGTAKRRDGKKQVTYGGHPLYYYADDPINKVLCQAVEEFGGLWYVVAPSGKAITAS